MLEFTLGIFIKSRFSQIVDRKCWTSSLREGKKVSESKYFRTQSRSGKGKGERKLVTRCVECLRFEMFISPKADVLCIQATKDLWWKRSAPDIGFSFTWRRADMGLSKAHNKRWIFAWKLISRVAFTPPCVAHAEDKQFRSPPIINDAKLFTELSSLFIINMPPRTSPTNITDGGEFFN